MSHAPGQTLDFGLAAVSALSSISAVAAEWTVERGDKGLTVKLDGQLVTEYLIRSGAKPILWPIIGPTGQPVTRAYPMLEVAGEQHDHVHQRSCWLTHGSVNGIDFWSEDETKGHGTIVHRGFDQAEGGSQVRITTHNDWLAPDGKRQCEDIRRITLSADATRRYLDFDFTLKASDGPVVFGDTKEGSFGVRVASSMRAENNLPGRIVNSEGQTGDAAWGKRAAWVDYSGPVDGRTVGIAILNHPSSFRFPTWWHVRGYGLFAANVFGLHDFAGEGDGSYTLPAGESLRLKYRIVLHAGDEAAGDIAGVYRAYAKDEP